MVPRRKLHPLASLLRPQNRFLSESNLGQKRNRHPYGQFYGEPQSFLWGTPVISMGCAMDSNQLQTSAMRKPVAMTKGELGLVIKSGGGLVMWHQR